MLSAFITASSIACGRPLRRAAALVGAVGQRLRDQRRLVGGIERPAAGQHLVGDHAERVDIGGGRDVFAAHLLRRGIGQRAEEERGIGQPRLVARRLHRGQAEVDHLVDALARLVAMRDDVGGLEVAMGDAAIVRELQRGGDGVEDRGDARRRHRRRRARSPRAGWGRSAAPSPGTGWLALSKPKSRRPTMLGWRSWAQARLSRRKRSRDSGGASGVACITLMRDVVAEVHAAGAVDVAHAAGAERVEDLVAIVDSGAGATARG